MAADRIITCVNKDGVSVSFGEQELSPFLLMSAEGVYTASNRVATTENTMMDGATYHGSTASMRNIVITVKDNENYPQNRAFLDMVFKEGEEGTLTFHEDGGEDKIIKYYVEKMDSDGMYTQRVHTISLLCPDPFFYSPTDVEVLLAHWEGLFEFEHEFLDAKEELGRQSPIRMAEIINSNMVDQVGMTIKIIAFGSVRNPSIALAETGEEIQVGSSAKPMNMVAGDEIVITTETGNKHVYFTHNGTTTEVNHYLTQDSVFLQLRRGANNIGFDADSGSEYMSVEIIYKMKFARA